jgi:hypothetical protein
MVGNGFGAVVYDKLINVKDLVLGIMNGTVNIHISSTFEKNQRQKYLCRCSLGVKDTRQLHTKNIEGL